MRIILAVATFAGLTGHLFSEEAPAASSPVGTAPTSAVMEETAAEWAFSGSVMGYYIPDDKDYLSPLLTADRDWLHMEGRYNYENFNTASMWLGANFSFGKKLVLDLTPMVGGVFGHTQGVAPGLRLALSRGAIEFTSEMEYVFDAQNSDDNYFYAWSELTWAPTDWCWVGLVGQRMRLFQSELDIQRGVLVGVTFKKLDFTAYVFNWGWADPTFVFSVGMEF